VVSTWVTIVLTLSLADISHSGLLKVSVSSRIITGWTVVQAMC